MVAIGGCAGPRRLSLHSLTFLSGTLVALCSSPNIRRLQHLELDDSVAWGMRIKSVGPPDAGEYQSAFSPLEHLQSLTLESVRGIHALLPHLHRAPTLRLLSIRCKPNSSDIEAATSPLPSFDVLSSLLVAAPQLEVRLLMPATLERWLALGHSIPVGRAVIEQQWRELQRMAAEMERVSVAGWQPPSA